MQQNAIKFYCLKNSNLKKKLVFKLIFQKINKTGKPPSRDNQGKREKTLTANVRDEAGCRTRPLDTEGHGLDGRLDPRPQPGGHAPIL